MTPDIYGFVEGSGNSRNYNGGLLNSQGYRVTAGVGTGRIGLMQGEVYAGYQAENFQSSAIGTAGGVAFGGQLDYTPLPELDLKVGADRTIGATQTTATAGTSTTVTQLLAIASYSLAREWTASGRAGYIHTDYKGINRADDSWTIGPTLTYSVWQNFGLTLDYQHIETTSNVPLASFTRDMRVSSALVTNIKRARSKVDGQEGSRKCVSSWWQPACSLAFSDDRARRFCRCGCRGRRPDPGDRRAISQWGRCAGCGDRCGGRGQFQLSPMMSSPLRKMRRPISNRRWARACERSKLLREFEDVGRQCRA